MTLLDRYLVVAVVSLQLVLATAPRAGAAPMYRVTDLGLGFEPRAMNDRGQIVGERSDPSTGIASAWLLDRGVLTPIVHAGMDEVRVEGINNHGLVVGRAESDDGLPRAFAWDKLSGWRFLESQSQDSLSLAYDVNDDGAVAGWFGAAGVRGPSGILTPVGQLGASGADVRAINARGEVVGFSGVGDGTIHHAYIWRDGVIRDLNVATHVPGGVTDFECAYDVNADGLAVGIAATYQLDEFSPSVGYGFLAATGPRGEAVRVTILPGAGLLAVNDAGMAAGWMRLDDGNEIDSAAAIYREGTLINLNDAVVESNGFYVGYAMDVNNRGQILADGWRGAKPESGPVNGLLLTPVPEPRGDVVVATSLAMVVAARRGRGVRSRR